MGSRRNVFTLEFIMKDNHRDLSIKIENLNPIWALRSKNNGSNNHKFLLPLYLLYFEFHYLGVYQMGEVYARSCPMVVAPSGISTS